MFDQDAAGYVRAETIGCLFLQKAKNSKRIYAQVSLFCILLHLLEQFLKGRPL